MQALDRFDHAAWLTTAATLASYGLILLSMFVLLFLLPFVVFSVAF